MIMFRLYLQGRYDAMSDMHQIGLMINSLSLWDSVDRPPFVREFVQLLVAKQVTAAEALRLPWVTSVGQI